MACVCPRESFRGLSRGLCLPKENFRGVTKGLCLPKGKLPGGGTSGGGGFGINYSLIMKCYPRLIICLLLGLLSCGSHLRADEREETTTSAVFLLRSCMQMSRDGESIRLLRALRQLKDPDLTPIFEELAQNPNPILKIHGVLGLAECDPQHKLDLLRIAGIKQAGLQAQVVSAAMDSDLLSDDEAIKLINWPGLDIGVRVLVATQLINHDKFDKPEILEEASHSDNLARRGFALMLQAHLGNTKALQRLDELHTIDDPERDHIREMLLRSALRYDLQSMGPWAMHIATEPGVGSRLGVLAMKAAMRFKIPEAQAVWQQQYASTSDVAQQMRLALLVLREAQTLSPKLFDPLIASDQVLLRNVGKAGRAIAAREQIADNVISLVGMANPHPIVTLWALQYAQFEASDDNATAILLALVLSFENAGERARSRLLEDAITAAHVLLDKYPEDARILLKPILENKQTDLLLLQGLWLAMIRSGSPEVLPLLDGLEPRSDITIRHLTLLIKARHGVVLSRNQLRELALVVRGGGVRDDALRVQAGWAYLKITRQTEDAITRVLSD